MKTFIVTIDQCLPLESNQGTIKIYYMTVYYTGVSISTGDQQNAPATLLRVVGYFFLQKRSN